jgi:hypothetical protein
LLPHFLPLYSIPRAKRRDKPRRKVDPELVITQQRYGWPNSKFASFGVAHWNSRGEVLSIMKYNNVQRFPPKDVEWEISYSMMDAMYKDIMVMNSRISTDEEVVNHMEGTKSPGPPFWDFVDTYDFLEKHPIELSQCFTYWRKFVLNLWTIKVKEELRPQEKLDLKKVRTFTSCNKAHYFLWMKIFLQQTKAFNQSSSILTEHTVGFNKFARGWDRLIKHLKEQPNCFDFDVDRNDGEMQNYEIEEYHIWCCSYFPEFSDDPEFRALCFDLLGTELFSQCVDSNGTVWLIPCGKKSGSPDTARCGTWVNQRRLRYAFCKLLGIKNFFEARAMWKQHVRSWQQIDDGIFSVSDEIVSKFNFTTIKAFYETQGWHISTLTPIPREVEDCVYLSSFSKIVGKYYVPYPVSDKIICSLKYTKILDKCISLSRAAILYIEGYYNPEVRDTVWKHITRMIQDYDKHLRNNRDWILAKSLVQSYLGIERLYLDDSYDPQPDPVLFKDLSELKLSAQVRHRGSHPN